MRIMTLVHSMLRCVIGIAMVEYLLPVERYDRLDP
jgi:hypothetical protein